ncbi:hypothetical protein VXQ18_07225 [Brucella abortus]|nr:hypothetical protein [Brucella abortus]
MARQMKAERDKRARFWKPRDRNAQILRAEGQKQPQILEAEGKLEAAKREAEARERLAEAEAKATTMVSQAVANGNVQRTELFRCAEICRSPQQYYSAPRTRKSC